MNGSENKSGPDSPGEWLRQLAVKLEQEALEDAARLLEVLHEQTTGTELEQAHQMVITRLLALSTGHGSPVKLLRFYHALSTGFPADHPFHPAFLEQMIASIRTLDPGANALATVKGLERALDILAPRFETFPDYGRLRSELDEMRDRSTRIVRAELELELRGYVAAGNPKRAIELCHMMIKRGVSPLADGVLPILEAEGASPGALAYLVGASGRSEAEDREHIDRTGWDTPAESLPSYPLENPRAIPSNAPGQTMHPRESTSVPSRRPWSLTFEAPPTGGPEPDAEPGQDSRSAPWGRGWLAPGHGTPERPEPPRGAMTIPSSPPVPGELEAVVEMLPDIEDLPSVGGPGWQRPSSGGGHRAIDDGGWQRPPSGGGHRGIPPTAPPPVPAEGIRGADAGNLSGIGPLRDASPETARDGTGHDPSEGRAQPLPLPPVDAAVSSGSRWRWITLLVVVLGVGLAWWMIGPPDNGEPREPESDQETTRTPESPVVGTVTPTIDPDVPDPAQRPLGLPGTLTLNISPSDKLELYVDGALQPDGRVEDMSVPPGNHIVVAYHEGYERLRAEVWVDPGASASEDLKLLESPHLNVNVTPAEGVELFLDGRRLLAGLPLREYPIPAGEHHLEVTRPEYEPQQIDFTASTGEKLNYDVSLVLLPR